MSVTIDKTTTASISDQPRSKFLQSSQKGAYKADDWLTQPASLGLSHCSWLLIGLLGVILIILVLSLIAQLTRKNRQPIYW